MMKCSLHSERAASDVIYFFFQGKSAKKDIDFDQPPPRERPGRQRKAPIVYAVSDDESDEDY